MGSAGKDRIKSRGRIRYGVELARFTSIGIGGPADLMVYPRDESDLADVLRQLGGRPVYVLGEGTNCLFPDAGFRGAVVNVRRAFRHLRFGGRRVTAGAGLKLSRVIRLALERGLGGMEDLAGIPGSVGGGVMMNAGAYGRTLGEVVSRLRLVRLDGTMSEVKRTELELDYRRPLVRFPAVVVEAELALVPVEVEAARRRINEISRDRKRKHPLQMPNAGSIFKNPPGSAAAQLIEEAGLKGFSLGGAKVSEKHANFIVNTGGATAAEVLELMELVQIRVRENSGVRLEPEVKVVGSG